MRISNLSIGKKLGVAFGFILLLTMVMGFLGFRSTGKINEYVRELGKSRASKLVYSAQASRAIADISSSIKMLIILKDERAMAAEKQKIDEARVRYTEAMDKLTETFKSTEGKKLLEDMKNTIPPAVQANNKVIALALAHKQDEAAAFLLKEANPLTQKVQEAFDALTRFQRESTDATYHESEKTYSHMKTTQMIIELLIMIGIGAAFYLTRHLTYRINGLVIMMEQIAKGDLSHHVPIHGSDELAELLFPFTRVARGSLGFHHAKDLPRRVVQTEDGDTVPRRRVVTFDGHFEAHLGPVAQLPARGDELRVD